MRLRTIGLVVTLALATPLAAAAQQPSKVPRIGVLVSSAREPSLHLIKALEEGLREVGYVEGRNIAIEYRFAEGRLERLPALAAELVRLNVDVIVAANNPHAVAARQATTTIPIVMTLAGDPVGEGLVRSLAQPGGNITGLTLDVTLETWAKRLQILKEVAPKVSRVAVLWNSAFRPNLARWPPTEEAARTVAVAIVSAEVRGPDDFESAFATMVRERAGGFIVFGDPVTLARRNQIVELAAKNRLPATYPWREGVDAGGLMSYGPNFSHLIRRAGVYIDKILKGAKPGDLPMEQPTRFELVINLKTAKALGLTIPPSVLIRADQVIQ